MPAAALRGWRATLRDARRGFRSRQKNSLYVARQDLVLGGESTGLPGWGVLARGRRLTAPERSPSHWVVPDWLNPARGGVGMTYHKSESFSADGSLRAAARGQEFVADVGERDDARDWLRHLIEEGR